MLVNIFLMLVNTVLTLANTVFTSLNTVFDDFKQCFDLSEHCNVSEFLLDMMTYCVGTCYPIPNVLRNLSEPTSLSKMLNIST